jgi:hypothetical protein
LNSSSPPLPPPFRLLFINYFKTMLTPASTASTPSPTTLFKETPLLAFIVSVFRPSLMSFVNFVIPSMTGSSSTSSSSVLVGALRSSPPLSP